MVALALHAGTLLIGRAMPHPTVASLGTRYIETIEVAVDPLPPDEPREAPPAANVEEPRVPEADRASQPEARLLPRDVRAPVAPSTAEPPAAQGPQPGAPQPWDALPDDRRQGGILGVPGVPGLGGPAWAMPGVFDGPAAAPKAAPTVAPAPRPVDRDIAGVVVREAMATRDKDIGIDLPVAGTLASAVRTAVQGSNMPSGSRGSIECRVGPNGVVSGCRVLSSMGGAPDSWAAAVRAAKAVAAGGLPSRYARGAIVTVDVSVNDSPPAGSKGGFTGLGASFDLSNIGAHATRQVRISHRVVAAR